MKTAVACVALLAVVSTARADPLRPDHPMIGAWRVSIDGCTETYRVDRSGAMRVTSAQQVSTSRVEISDQPSDKGFYKWVDTVVDDNGKKDCGGHVTPVGDVAVDYILMSPKHDRFLMCSEEATQTCLGPFVRVEGEGV